MRRTIAAPALHLAAVAVVALTGCDSAAPSTRTVELEPAKRVSTATRLGFRPRIQLDHVTPPGWVKRPAKSFRLIDMALPGTGETTCLVSFVPGAAGGVVANVNRWRRQMQLDPITPEETSQLPRAPLLGQSAVVLELEGTYADSMRDMQRPGWKMLGAMARYEATGDGALRAAAEASHHPT